MRGKRDTETGRNACLGIPLSMAIYSNIFFDWDNKGSSGPQDGLSDHVGIVQKVENGIVYTVEGNFGESVRINQYSVGHYEILSFGVPQY